MRILAVLSFTLFSLIVSTSTVADPKFNRLGGLSCDGPDVLKKWACLIQQEAAGAAIPPAVAPVEFYSALQALNVVQTMVSTGRYSYLKRMLGQRFVVPGEDPRVCIDAGYGLCGNHIVVFNAIMDELRIPARSLMFFYNENGSMSSHIVSEVKIAGRWVMFDVTWGSVYFRDLQDLSSYLGYDEIVQIGYESVHPLRNELATWYFSRSGSSYDTLYHMKTDDLDIVRAGIGSIRANLSWSDSGATWGGDQYYGFIGDNEEDGDSLGSSYYWSQPAGHYRIDYASRVGGCIRPAKLCVDANCVELDRAGTTFTYNSLGGHTILSLQSDEDVCYSVPTDIRIRRVDE